MGFSPNGMLKCLVAVMLTLPLSEFHVAHASVNGLQ